MGFALAGRARVLIPAHHRDMKVFSLQCEQGHAFEGWFGSEDAYVEQCRRGLVECHVMAQTEDVGERFADEARRIHYGEAQERGIRGSASQEEAQSLRDEGIEVHALPVPESLKGPEH